MLVIQENLLDEHSNLITCESMHMFAHNYNIYYYIINMHIICTSIVYNAPEAAAMCSSVFPVSESLVVARRKSI